MPDVLIKGSDYREQDVIGYSFLKAYGGKVLLAPFVEGYSTTKILTNITEVAAAQ